MLSFFPDQFFTVCMVCHLFLFLLVYFLGQLSDFLCSDCLNVLGLLGFCLFVFFWGGVVVVVVVVVVFVCLFVWFLFVCFFFVCLFVCLFVFR